MLLVCGGGYNAGIIMTMTPTLKPPVFMFAADHRWQWDEWCDQNSVERTRIPEAKSLIVDAFLLARSRFADVRDSGALLLDPTYAAAEIARATAEGVTVGTPAERAGVFPLEWSAEPFEQDLTGSFVKVLVRHHPDQPEAIRAGQLQRIKTLQSWCRDARKPFVLEVLVTREHEPEDEFERVGRPRALADYIATAYAADVVPEYWKIEGVPDVDAIRPIDEAIAARPGVRQLVLGKNAGLERIRRWFAATAEAETAGGFAIGRTIYWGPATAYLQDAMPRSEAVAAIADNYQRVIELWTRH